MEDFIEAPMVDIPNDLDIEVCANLFAQIVLPAGIALLLSD